MTCIILGVSCEGPGCHRQKKAAGRLKGKAYVHIDFDESGHVNVNTDDWFCQSSRSGSAGRPMSGVPANYPVVYDVFLGEKSRKSVNDPFASVNKIESLSTKQRWEFWQEQFGKCLRCYACRSACPMCYCEECVVDTINFAVTAATNADEKGT